jgi:hypothetical protein
MHKSTRGERLGTKVRIKCENVKYSKNSQFISCQIGRMDEERDCLIDGDW